MGELIKDPTFLSVILALIAAAPAYFAYQSSKRNEDEAHNIRVYTVYDKLLEQAQSDNAELRQRIIEAEIALRECLNKVPKKAN